MKQKGILCFFDYFYPAYKSGGPARSSLGLVENLSSMFEFWVISRDRDKDELHSFSNAEINTWFTFQAGVKVCYLSPKRWIRNMIRAVKKTDADVYYFNSFYSPKFTIIPLLLIKLGFFPKKPIVLAPRGEFSPNAMKIGGTKKSLYRLIFRWLFREVRFHATARHEEQHIRNVFDWAKIVYAPNLRSLKDLSGVKYCSDNKVSGTLNILFLSRISPMKNLDYAVKILAQCQANLNFSIYGPIDDPAYWSMCQEQIKSLPDNVKVEYHGAIVQDKVIDTIQSFDLLFLPTRGENYGHIVLESLVASRPVLISDKTPWNQIQERKAGWICELSKPDEFVIRLNQLANLGQDEFNEITGKAYEYGQFVMDKQDQTRDHYQSLFNL